MLKVKFPSVMVSITGERIVELDINECTLKELIDSLSQRYGERFREMLIQNGELNKFINVFVNGKDVRHLGGLSVKLKKGDEVSFVPAVAGG